MKARVRYFLQTAETALDLYHSLQTEIDAHDEKATTKHGGNARLAIQELAKDVLYVTKCAARDRAIQLATMYATIAIAHANEDEWSSESRKTTFQQ